MTRADMMRNKRAVGSVDLIKLLKRIDNYSNVLVCVFEGEDAKYYGARIDSVFNSIERKNLSCKGKGNVISLRDKVKRNKELSQAKILYFVDADFDGDCNDSDIYCTPCYSIENLYARPEVFKKILTDEFGLCSFRDGEVIEALCNAYETYEQNYDDALLDLNSWICMRKEQRKLNADIRLNLNNLKLDAILDFSESGPFKKYTLETLDEYFSIEEPIDGSEFQKYKLILSQHDLRDVSRGKYRIECFRVYLSRIVEDARKRKGKFAGVKCNPKMTLSKAQLISELSQYALTPECLMNFLRGNYETLAA